MSLDSMKTSVVDCPETPGRRARRVVSERSAARRKLLVAQLSGPTVVAEDVGLLTDQAHSISQAFMPRNAWQDWLTSTIATIMVRINRCERVERKLRDLASYRAIDFWEDDQVLEVETLGSKLDRDPAKVVAKLRQTPAGIDWLLRRWRLLARVESAGWTSEQRTLAGRLVGGQGDGEVDPTRAGFAAEAVAELASVRTRVEEADAIIRGLVEADLSDDHVPGLANLRRYARSLHRQLKWFVDQFHVEHPDRWDDPRRKPAFDGSSGDTRTTRTGGADSISQIDKTKPFAPNVAVPVIDETKPTGSGSRHEIDETNPFERVEQGAAMADSVSQAIAIKEVVARKPDDDLRRKRRVDPVLEVARRRKAARRRGGLMARG